MRKLLKRLRAITTQDLRAVEAHLGELEQQLEAVNDQPEAVRKAIWLGSGFGPEHNSTTKFMRDFVVYSQALMEGITEKKLAKARSKGRAPTGDDYAVGQDDIMAAMHAAIPKSFSPTHLDLAKFETIYQLYSAYLNKHTFDVVERPGEDGVVYYDDPIEKRNYNNVLGNIYTVVTLLTGRKEEQELETQRLRYLNACQNYLNEIEGRILDELKVIHESTHDHFTSLQGMELVNEKGKLVRKVLSPGQHIINSLQDNAVTRSLIQSDPVFKLNIEKYKAAQELKNTLTSNKSIYEQHQDYSAARDKHKEVLTKNPDSTEKKVLKVLFSVVSCFVGVGLVLTPILWATVWKPVDKTGENLVGKDNTPGLRR